MASSLEKDNTRLRYLVDSFSQVNSSLVLETVLENTLKRATELTAAAVGSIALIDESCRYLEFVQSTDRARDKLLELRIPIDKGIAGHVVRTGQPIRVEDCYSDPRFYSEVDHAVGSKTRTYLCVPLVADGAVIGTVQIMNRADGASFTHEDQEVLTSFAQQASLAIKNAQRHRLLLRQKEIDSELRLCATIQSNFFPKDLPRVEGYEIFGSTVPCREIGGDYYTFVSRPDGRIEAVQADVSGKGVAAALTVSEIHSAIHLLGETDRSLVDRVTALNRHLGRSLVLGRFTTLLALSLDPPTGQVEFVVAGHIPPRIVSRDGRVRVVPRTHPVLGPGLLQKKNVKSERDVLAPGELLVGFTDGYSEANSLANKLYGEANVIEVIRRSLGEDLPTIRTRLDEAVASWQEGKPRSDDMSLLLLRRQ